MVFSAFDAKQQVKDATDIVDLVGSYLQLRRDGRGYKALCPWHDDSRPSLQVNPERQSWKCWVCNLGGDVFSFLMQHEGVTFPEALRMLADRAGIQLEQQRGPGQQSGDEKRVLYQAMEWVDKQYHRYLLTDPQAEIARKYLDERGISERMIEKFMLGFAPDAWDWILERAKSTPYSPRILEKVGVVKPRDNGPGVYDRFRARVMFPIFDPQGRDVGTGGRVIPGIGQADAAKYLNSPETPLFSKHKLLYGLNVARDAIRKTKTALIMEGYTDCIMAHQFGFENAVAVLGTALGAPQIRLLSSFGENVRMVLVLDGDEAGQRRAMEVLELFIAASADLRVLTLPEEFDPCELLLERGAAEFQKLIDEAPDALTHAERKLTSGIDLVRDVHTATQAMEQILAVIANARPPEATADHLREQRILTRMARDFRVPEEPLREKLKRIRKVPQQTSTIATQSEPASVIVSVDQLDPYERELLAILIRWPELITRVMHAIEPEELQNSVCREVYLLCCRLSDEGVAGNFDRLLLEFDDQQVKNLLVDLDELGQRRGAPDFETPLRDVLAGFERRKQQPWRHAQTAALKEKRLEEDEELAFLLQLQQQERNRQGISKLTDG